MGSLALGVAVLSIRTAMVPDGRCRLSEVIGSPTRSRYMGRMSRHRFQMFSTDVYDVSRAIKHAAIGAMGFERPSPSLRRLKLRPERKEVDRIPLYVTT